MLGDYKLQASVSQYSFLGSPKQYVETEAKCFFLISFRKQHQNVNHLCSHHGSISELFSFQGSFVEPWLNDGNIIILTKHIAIFLGTIYYVHLANYYNVSPHVRCCWLKIGNESICFFCGASKCVLKSHNKLLYGRID